MARILKGKWEWYLVNTIDLETVKVNLTLVEVKTQNVKRQQITQGISSLTL